MKEDVLRLKLAIENSNNIVFLGGAGVSTESGIKDFRSDEGLYNETPEEILSNTFFRMHPETFYDFYKKNMINLNAKPNKAHIALSRLESSGKLKALITQNVDLLHEMAGSKNIIKVHGDSAHNHCIDCKKDYSINYIANSNDVPRCTECGGLIKPDIVLYEECLDPKKEMAAISAIKNADMLIIGGTSLSVYPVASYIEYFNGENLFILNDNENICSSYSAHLIIGKVGEILDQAIK